MNKKKMKQELVERDYGFMGKIMDGIGLGFDDHHIHHIKPRCEGGSDDKSNLILLGPSHHRQLHSDESKEDFRWRKLYKKQIK